MHVGNPGYSNLSANQKPASELRGLSEVRREFYLRRLLKLAVVGVILGVIFLLFWAAVTAPRFDERYAVELLARHDGSVLAAKFDEVEAPGGIELSASDLFIENGMFTVRDATVSRITEGNETTVTGSELLYFGPRTLNVGTTNRSWACPDETWLNMSTQETKNYFYIGIAGSWLTQLFVQDSMSEWNLTDAAITEEAAAANVTSGEYVTYAPQIAEASGQYITQVWYFNPDDRTAYEQQIADVETLASECQEVQP